MAGATFPDDLFSILEILEGAPDSDSLSSLNETTVLVSPKVAGGTISSSTAPQKSQTEAEAEASHDHKKQKLSEPSTEEAVTNNPDGQQRVSHITVEKNRGKQMNEQLSFLRSVVPCIYVKRGDQASIIGGVVDYIKELQQVLQSLEAKKQRKVYGEVLNPRPSQLNPRRPPPPLPLSPRLSLPISPRTPQPGSPYLPKMQQSYLSPITMASTLHEASLSSSPSSFDNVKELSATSKSAIAEVEVKISGPNVLLKTKSPRIPGQVVKIVAALESLALEVLHVSINTVDDTMLHSFIIKVTGSMFIEWTDEKHNLESYTSIPWKSCFLKQLHDHKYCSKDLLDGHSKNETMLERNSLGHLNGNNHVSSGQFNVLWDGLLAEE